jgi:adenylate kinase family enzyme
MNSDQSIAAENLELVLMLGGPYQVARHVVILGNSGSGKSTLARSIAAVTGGAHLDLDTVAWEPRQIAVPRHAADAQRDVRAFCAEHESWVVEGCYGTLVREVLSFRPRLLLLDPSVERCVANCRARSWEPHKYSSKEEQDSRLGSLIDWVREYETRTGELGRADHLACFRAYDGPKLRLTGMPRVASGHPERAHHADR